MHGLRFKAMEFKLCMQPPLTRARFRPCEAGLPSEEVSWYALFPVSRNTESKIFSSLWLKSQVKFGMWPQLIGAWAEAKCQVSTSYVYWFGRACRYLQIVAYSFLLRKMHSSISCNTQKLKSLQQPRRPRRSSLDSLKPVHPWVKAIKRLVYVYV